MNSRAGENSLLQYKLFIRPRASATQGTPLGNDDLKWVANTTTLVYFLREMAQSPAQLFLPAGGARLTSTPGSTSGTGQTGGGDPQCAVMHDAALQHTLW